MSGKKTTTLLVDEELREKAKKNGLKLGHCLEVGIKKELGLTGSKQELLKKAETHQRKYNAIMERVKQIEDIDAEHEKYRESIEQRNQIAIDQCNRKAKELDCIGENQIAKICEEVDADYDTVLEEMKHYSIYDVVKQGFDVIKTNKTLANYN